MFTGIIEAQGIVTSITPMGTGKTFRISTPLSAELKVDQSLSHNGICLTVEAVTPTDYQVTAIQETLSKTDMSDWKTGDTINLERCMVMNGRLDGHIVQGHIDTTAVCTEKKEMDGSWEYRFTFPKSFSTLMIEKGSVCLNGISLTAFNVGTNEFTVAIIPYTHAHTNIHRIEAGDRVNIEFDVVGKYIQRMAALK